MENRLKNKFRNIILIILGIAAVIYAVTNIRFSSVEKYNNESGQAVIKTQDETTVKTETATEGLLELESITEPQLENTLTAVEEQVETTVETTAEKMSEAINETVTEMGKDENNSNQYINCTIQVRCDEAATIKSTITNEGIKALIPDDGVILSETHVKVKANSNVYEILEAVLKDNGIPMVSNTSNTYISSINQLSEKMLGKSSGWTYKVNQVMPMKPALYYEVLDGDVISFEYVCG